MPDPIAARRSASAERRGRCLQVVHLIRPVSTVKCCIVPTKEMARCDARIEEFGFNSSDRNVKF